MLAASTKRLVSITLLTPPHTDALRAADPPPPRPHLTPVIDKFRMEGIRTAARLMTPGCVMWSTDLWNGYKVRFPRFRARSTALTIAI